jgi:hypothetical protein
MSSVAEKLQRKSQRQVAVKQVRLKLVYVDFWSAVKLSFLIAVCLGVVLVVATILVWIVLNSTGIFRSLDNVLRDILGDPQFSVAKSFSLPQVAVCLIRCGAAEHRGGHGSRRDREHALQLQRAHHGRPARRLHQ